MKTMSVSIEEDLYHSLKAAAGPRGMSRFIAAAVREKLRETQDSLYDEYRKASRDRERQAEIGDWAAVDGEAWD